LKLYLRGTDNKYAVEQMLFTLYPGEKPEYPETPPSGDRIEVNLSEGKLNTTITCKLTFNNKSYTGRTSVKSEKLTDKLIYDRYVQRMIKTAFYRASLKAGHEKPAWGALTGVRPAKLMTELLNNGLSDDEAVKEFMAKYDVTEERSRLCLAASHYSIDTENSIGPKDVCLYVGIPFCPTRCNYCSFVSQSIEKSTHLIPPFMEALLKEIESTSDVVNELGLNVISIYIGGGTPSILSAEQLDVLCCKLESSFNLKNCEEFTVEAGRPDTITKEKLITLKNHNVSRLSINPQTMTASVLEAIGRRHTPEDVVEALKLVRKTGDFEINMDLIAGLTTDTYESFKATIDTVLKLKPDNITIHTLSLKKGSRITLDGAKLPTPGEVSKMLDYASEKLTGAEYEPYYLYRQKNMSGGFENVGWTTKGHSNLYNICIMEELCSIIAMGGGGSTKLVAPGDGKNIRIVAPKYPTEYISHINKTCEDKNNIKEFYNAILTS